MENHLSASLEDYLEAIYNVIAENQAVRTKDIAGYLDVKNSSVTSALKVLKKKNLINYKPYGVITLTSSGKKLAEDVVRKHRTLKTFFTDILGVEEGDADRTACCMEHEIPKSIVDRLIDFSNFVEQCSISGKSLLEHFKSFYNEDEERNDPFGKQNGSPVNLSELSKGQKGRIVKLDFKEPEISKFKGLGLKQGITVEVTAVPPGNTMNIKIQDFFLSIDMEDALHIQVEII